MRGGREREREKEDKEGKRSLKKCSSPCNRINDPEQIWPKKEHVLYGAYLASVPIATLTLTVTGRGNSLPLPGPTGNSLPFYQLVRVRLHMGWMVGLNDPPD